MFALQGPFLIEIIFNGNPIVLFYNLSRRQSLRCGANAEKKSFCLNILWDSFFIAQSPPNEIEPSYPSYGNVKGRCACEIIYGSPERQKKSYLKGYLAAIKRLML